MKRKPNGRHKRRTQVNRVNRPPLTQKAKAAIILYAELKNEFPTLQGVVHYTLIADRLPRDKLYSYLKYRGYRWKNGVWIKK